jgi:diguanylate cyclase (GGDEF)-like protein
MLKSAAMILKSHFRSSDLVARIGGDEFAVLLPRCPVRKTREKCESLKKANLTRYIPDTQIPLMMSIGYATREGNKIPMDDVVKEADTKMYEEKLKNRQAFREIFKNVMKQK